SGSGRHGRNSSVTRLNSEDAAERTRDSDGPRAVGADMDDAEIERGGGGASRRRAASCHFRVPGIVRDARQGAVAYAFPSELGRARLAENNGASINKARGSLRAVGDGRIRRIPH